MAGTSIFFMGTAAIQWENHLQMVVILGKIICDWWLFGREILYKWWS
jgi:hypothetical protein